MERFKGFINEIFGLEDGILGGIVAIALFWFFLYCAPALIFAMIAKTENPSIKMLVGFSTGFYIFIWMLWTYPSTPFNY